MRVTTDGAELCVDTFGDPADPAVLLIMGGAASMDRWEEPFCSRLAAAGRYVIRYDHRDTGRSTTYPPGKPGYTGDDLAADALAVLDGLGVQRAHFVGMSMGGGIVQRIAVDHPGRVLSATLMSTSPAGSGGAELPPMSAALRAVFAGDGPAEPDWSDREAAIAYLLEGERPYAGSRGLEEDALRALLGRVYDRSPSLASADNHFLVEGTEMPRARLAGIRAPVLVVHGTDDPLFPPAHGEALAREIPGARLLLIDGLGHEVPPSAWDEVLPALIGVTGGPSPAGGPDERMEGDEVASADAQTGYAPVEGLSMYYEIHGRGRPLLLLHGAYMTIDMMEPLLSGLAATRRVIAPEQQGHGRTADVDRPITYEQMADDTAALIRHLQLEDADVVGYSLGGGIALQLAIRHPALVRKIVLASASFASDGQHAVALEMFPSITPELFAGSPIEEAYLRLAPNPGDFPMLVEKLTRLDTTDYAWPAEEIRAIAAPTLIVLGDSDGIRLEHAVELFGLRGGGVMGDLQGLPASQLAVLPGTTHFVPPGSGLLDRAEWLLAMIPPFLDAPMPEGP